MSTKAIKKVREAFNEWHGQRNGRRTNVPSELCQQAVALLEHHRAKEICDELRISPSNLRRWRTARSIREANSENLMTSPVKVKGGPKMKPAPKRIDFVEVGTTGTSSRLHSQKSVEWESADGKRMRISGVMSLEDIQTIAERFLSSNCGGNK